jgi:ferrous iron transport protein B
VQKLQAVVLTKEPEATGAGLADRVLLHPVAGLVILTAVLFLVFQSVFAFAAWPMEQIEAGAAALQRGIQTVVPEGGLQSLLTDGILAGVGSVVIFLPQILILFFFLLLLEMSGYMARAAFLTDELMRRAGLSGRAVIPLLSSFACAIPGMMAARTLPSERDRLVTILVAPLMTCSARLPVYAVLIAAFIPASKTGPFSTQGLVLFGLYLAAVLSGILVALVLKRYVAPGARQSLVMELPSYKWPQPKDLLIGLWRRAGAFLRRAGTIIFTVSIALWVLVSYPGETLRESFAGRLGSLIEPIFKPIGFTLEMVIALVPGLAAREVAVGALGTVYAVQNAEEDMEGLASVLQNEWSLAAALAFLAWYVFAPQCVSTIAVARRETNSARWTAFMVGYLFALAYLAAGITYWTARAFGG